MAVVHVINSLKCKDQSMLHLMRCLHFFTAQFDIKLRATHIQGVLNIPADAVSRNNLQVFREAVPGSSLILPVPIPPQLWQLTVTQMPDWLSPIWRSLLVNCWKTVQLKVQDELIFFRATTILTVLSANQLPSLLTCNRASADTFCNSPGTEVLPLDHSLLFISSPFSTRNSWPR